MAKNTAPGSRKRLAAREQFWPTEVPWTGENEKGWFRAPRTLPLILALISSKAISGNTDPTRVYLELLARHLDSGIVRMGTDEEHAYAAGYTGDRGVRSWRERMNVLERAGLIKVKRVGGKHFAYVLIVHPSVFIPALRRAGKVDEEWDEAYRSRQLETGEIAPPADPIEALA